MDASYGLLAIPLIIVIVVFIMLRQGSQTARYTSNIWKHEGCTVSGSEVFSRKTNLKTTDDLVKKLEEMKKLPDTPVNLHEGRKITSYELKIVGTEVIAYLHVEDAACMGSWDITGTGTWTDEGCEPQVDKSRIYKRTVNPQKRDLEVAGLYAVSTLTPAELLGKAVVTKKHVINDGRVFVLATVKDDGCALAPVVETPATETPATETPATETPPAV